MNRIKREENEPDNTPTVNELAIRVDELTHELNAKTLELEGAKLALRDELKEKAELKYKNQLLEAKVADLTEQLKASDRRSLHGSGNDSDRQRNNWGNNTDRQHNNWNNGDRKRTHSQARTSSGNQNCGSSRYFPPQRSCAPSVSRQRSASQARYFPPQRSRNQSVSRQRNASQTRYFPQSRSRASSVNQRNKSTTRHNSGNANLVQLADRRQSYDQMQFGDNQPFANQNYPYNLAHFQSDMNMNSNQQFPYQNMYSDFESGQANQHYLNSFFIPMQPPFDATQQGQPAMPNYQPHIFTPSQPISLNDATSTKRPSSVHQPRRIADLSPEHHKWNC